MDTSESLTFIKEWLNNKDVNISQYEIPPNGFSSFNDFFTREIKRSVRPVDNTTNSIVSPADG